MLGLERTGLISFHGTCALEVPTDQNQNFESFCSIGHHALVIQSSTFQKPKVQNIDLVCTPKFSPPPQSRFRSSPNIPVTTSHIDSSLPCPLPPHQSKLIHHYTAVANANVTAAHTLQSKSLWTIAVPKMAFQSLITFHSLLAISALHLSFLLPHDLDLFQMSLKHHARALSIQRKALASVTPTNAESILAASVLLGTHAWLSSHTKQSKDGEGKYEIPTSTYRMIQGVWTLSSQIAPLLPFHSPDDWYNNTSSTIEQVLLSPKPQDHVMPWLNSANDSIEWYMAPSSPTLPTCPLPSQLQRPFRQAFLLEAQQDLSRLFTAFADDSASPQEAFTYRLALVELSTLYNIVTSISFSFSITELHRRILNFPLRLPKELKHWRRRGRLPLRCWREVWR
jgi:hypothetical protein